MEMAVAERPLLGMRTRMMVSALVDTSSPARSVASSSSDKGFPCASVRLSMPTSRMSTAPSSPPPPRAAVLMRPMPDSSERRLFQAMPVPTITSTVVMTATMRNSRPGTRTGYWRAVAEAGSPGWAGHTLVRLRPSAR
ncbi:hypothetical protein MAUB1S_01950 [Mycolicibacterium aubagnense]